MQFFGLASLLITILIIGWWFVSTNPVSESPTVSLEKEVVLDPVIEAEIKAHNDLIQLTSPKPNEKITSPLLLTGKARGNWYFEGSFPVVLTDWDGRIIAEGVATAEGEWMVTDFVPFTATLHFESPYHAGGSEFMSRGSLILRKDNPSGLPEKDDALEIPIIFVGDDHVPLGGKVSTYNQAIDQAHQAADSLKF